MLNLLEKKFQIGEEVIIIKQTDYFYGFIGKVSSHIDQLSEQKEEYYKVKVRTNKRGLSTFQYRTLNSNEIILNSKICRFLYG